MSSNTVYIGNLDEKVEQRMLYEVMVQAGPLAGVSIPRNKISKQPQGFGFAEFTTEESAVYAIKLFSGVVTLFGKPLNFNFASIRRSPRVENNGGLLQSSASCYQVPVMQSSLTSGYYGHLRPPGKLGNSSPISGSAVTTDHDIPSTSKKFRRKRFVSDAIEVCLRS